MNKLWPLLLLVIPLQSIHAQDQHAPTVEQCRADQRLWLSELEGPQGLLRPLAPLATQSC